MKEQPGQLSDTQYAGSHELPDGQVASEVADSPATQYLGGARLHLLTATLCLCLFLTNLEIPIVSTSLISIAGDLGGLEKLYWITTAYMLGYAGILVLSAKFSDILGRKTCLLVAVILFVVFSAACGAAQTMNQLIIFRALQGLGGAGNYAISTIIVLEMIPPEKFAKYTGLVSAAFVFSLLFGPIFGGAITQHSTWRWIFLLNVPAGVAATIALIFLLPNGFPYHSKAREDRGSLRESIEKAFRRIDIVGAFLLVAATVLLVTGLDEADEQFAWRSAFTIAVLVISGVLWILFAIWERRVTLNASTTEPVFPWRFFQNRVWISMLLNAIFLGMNWFVTIFILPQRFEIVNQLTPFHAAIRFIPFTVSSPVGSMLAPTIAKAFRIPLMYLLIIGSAIQVVAFALLGTMPSQHAIPARQYGYEFLGGFGCGISIPILTLMTPFSTEKRDHAVAMGAIAQFRVMGGSIGLAIATAIQHSYIRSHLRQFLAGNVVEALLQSASAISTLPTGTQDLVRGTYAVSYNMQMKFLACTAGAQLLTSLMMWQQNPIVAS
ncbi:MFS general substrate transporter [Penicillium cataractarum]|uniref:MFS general substrate transporter n=1 Tax=Penicillium cataractarum TaxID=2100454 RepID=A0A9W9VVD3_9EURO|nr:MFS general substrate transporter [Penicillium cataractarum]KAJ5390077.1 MFS general substrate transporter [Penicillium cataractarum]